MTCRQDVPNTPQFSRSLGESLDEAERLLGIVDLMLGDPTTARENFLQSLRWREQMPDIVNKRVEIQRQWAGQRSIRRRHECVDRRPNKTPIRRPWVTVRYR